MNLRETRWKKKIKTINSIPPPPTYPTILSPPFSFIFIHLFPSLPFIIWLCPSLQFGIGPYLTLMSCSSSRIRTTLIYTPFPPTGKFLSLRQRHHFPFDTDTPFPPTRTLLSLRHGHSFPSDTDTPFPPTRTLLSLRHGHSFASDMDTLFPPTRTLFSKATPHSLVG